MQWVKCVITRYDAELLPLTGNSSQFLTLVLLGAVVVADGVSLRLHSFLLTLEVPSIRSQQDSSASSLRLDEFLPSQRKDSSGNFFFFSGLKGVPSETDGHVAVETRSPMSRYPRHMYQDLSA